MIEATHYWHPWLTESYHPASQVTAHQLFDTIIMGVIACNCVTSALDTPFIHKGDVVDERNNESLVIFLAAVDVVFTLIFTAESTLKSIAWSFCHGPDSYLQANGWNRLDFAIVLVSWVDYAASTMDIGFLKIFRLLRAFRALRFLNRVQGLQSLVCRLY